MTVDLYRIDGIQDSDEAIAALEEYVAKNMLQEYVADLETVQTSDLLLDHTTMLESHGEAPPPYPDWDEE
jgi:hypothetical protein